MTAPNLRFWAVVLVLSATAVAWGNRCPAMWDPEPAPDGEFAPDPPGREWVQRGRGPHRDGGGPRGPRHRRHDLAPIFHPGPEDQGPLLPGEEQELHAFVTEHLPGLAQLVDRLAEQGERTYRRNFRKLVPQLRHLRRLHADNPELATLVGRHAEGMVRVQTLRRAWDGTPPEDRPVLERRIRRHIADGVRVQIDAMRLWADQLEARRDDEVARRLAILTEPEAELAAEPPPVRELVRAAQSAADESQQQDARQRLIVLLERRVDSTITGLRNHAADMTAGMELEVDRRFERVMQRGHGPGSGRGPGPGRGFRPDRGPEPP